MLKRRLIQPLLAATMLMAGGISSAAAQDIDDLITMILGEDFTVIGAAEEVILETGSTAADVYQAAGYDATAKAVRADCSQSSNYMSCALTLSKQTATFMVYREHAVLTSLYRAAGYDQVANTYSRCDEGDTELGYLDCGHALVHDPVAIATMEIGFLLADAYDVAGADQTARDLRKQCDYQKWTELLPQFIACSLQIGLSPVWAGAEILYDDIISPPRWTPPACEQTALMTSCTSLRPNSFSGLDALAALDLSGDAKFDRTDIDLMRGAQLDLRALIATLPNGGSDYAFSLGLLDAIAVLPSEELATPVEADLEVLLASMMAAESSIGVQLRRAARLSP